MIPAQLREIADFIAAVTGELLAFELPTRTTDGE